MKNALHPSMVRTGKLSAASRVAILMIVFVASTISASMSEESSPAEFTLDAERQKLSVAITTIPADELLGEIGRAAGLRVRIRGELGVVRPQAFHDLPLDEAIRRLFATDERSLIMLYDEVEGEHRLAEVRLSPRSAAPAPAERQRPTPETRSVAGAIPVHALPPPPPRVPPPPPPPPLRR